MSVHPTIRGIALLGAISVIPAAPAGAAVTTVYKCFDTKLGVLYTDTPCRGEQLSIEGGSVDPVAIEELKREREAVARSAAERVSDYRRAAIERDLAPSYVAAAPPVAPGPAYGGGDYYYPNGYAYLPSYTPDRGRGRFDHGRGQRDRARQTVPAQRGDLIRR